MTNKENIDYLLSDIRELERKIASMRDTEIYPISFFNNSFELTQKILTSLHSIEKEQIECLKRNLAEHEAMIRKEVELEREEMPVQEPTSVREPAEEIIPEVEPIQPAPSPEPEIQAAPKKHTVVSSEVLGKKILSDFRKSLSLNDKYFFKRELFGGSEDLMSDTLNQLNDLDSYEASLNYIKAEFNWDAENPAVDDFIKRIEKRFL
jgi:hypothetical protein